jgi:hypothetical protein
MSPVKDCCIKVKLSTNVLLTNADFAIILITFAFYSALFELDLVRKREKKKIRLKNSGSVC